MKAKRTFILVALTLGMAVFGTLVNQEHTHHFQFNKPHGSFEIKAAYAYPPAVGILSNSKNCVSCHAKPLS